MHIFHKWGKYEVKEKGKLYDSEHQKGYPIGSYVVIAKECTACGMIKTKVMKNS